MTRQPRVVIIGAGMSGICMAITLLRNGFDDLTIYEKAERGGGTWRDNTYPGLSCDVPSRFYQFTFAPNPGWSHFFSPGPEIDAYFARVASEYGLPARTRFGTEVTAAEFQDGRWSLTTANGDSDSADFVITATGLLHHPRLPHITGMETFAGASFHSARWDHSVPLSGKRIGVIGTGSTGVQIVSALAGDAAHVDMFQRTPHWVLPIPNFRYSRAGSALYRGLPVLNKVSYRLLRGVFEWFAVALIEPGQRRDFIETLCRISLLRIRDGELRAALTPDFDPMCKRLIISSGFFTAVNRDDVRIVTAAIDHIEPRGVVTVDGDLHELDVLVYATGFDAHAFMRPMKLTGRDGMTIDRAWAETPRGFQTVTIPGFPNLFTLIGPHSPVGNYALTAIAESQADHILGWIQRWSTREFDSVEPKQQATDDFNAAIREAMPGTVWASGCDSWYLGPDGTPELWPWTPDRHRNMMRHPDTADYTLRSGDRG
ncbi:flavin-containing monooxygenase [Nocardia sp. NPDC056100]|uniref:flavin-containing monooxygenase n=1 Tax=Nocardia sp. NPDC056100 TaxID=3345712 RepID=UPI0035E23656